MVLRLRTSCSSLERTRLSASLGRTGGAIEPRIAGAACMGSCALGPSSFGLNSERGTTQRFSSFNQMHGGVA
jgi:hypothetical protein